MLGGAFGLTEPHVDQAGVEVRVGDALRMAQALGELHRFVAPDPRPVGALHPQQHPFDDVADHSGVVAGLEPLDLPRRAVVRGDSLFQMVDPGLQMGEQTFAGADQEMPLDAGRASSKRSARSRSCSPIRRDFSNSAR